MRRLEELRPGMEHVDLRVRLLRIGEPREVTTYSGLEHTLVEGEVEDESGRMGITVWNEKIGELEGLEAEGDLELRDCFITSYKGVLNVNVGRDSQIIRL